MVSLSADPVTTPLQNIRWPILTVAMPCVIGAGSTTLDCGGNLCFQLGGNDVIIADLTIKNGVSASSGGVWTIGPGKHATVSGAVIVSSQAAQFGGVFNVFGLLMID